VLRSHRWTAALVTAVVTAGAACIEPAPRPPNVSPSVAKFVDGVLLTMQAYSVRRDSVDWSFVRDTVATLLDGAEMLEDAEPALAVALELLGDNHSWIRRPQGSFIPYPTTISCSAVPPNEVAAPADIGYVKVPGYSGFGTDTLATAYIDGLERVI
jgi:hypothetical protein